jgi:signal transduction histidine kinase
VVVVEIDDSGDGISDSVMENVFDPFFTTKPVGEGTGLGLSISKNIVELHGGKLELVNRTEGGVRAAITFVA